MPRAKSTVLTRVLEDTQTDLKEARQRRAGTGKRVDEQLSYSIYFAKHFGKEIASALSEEFGPEDVRSGETPSDSSEGQKKVDVAYSTPEGGLGIMVSLKSVHQGEKANGDARFTHNLKRNDEELRVEATALHIRQPYAVLVAVMILPFEACGDGWPQGSKGSVTSSFGRWVEKFWSLKGRVEPDDAPNLFELAFIALYARDGSELGFYQVGGEAACPRQGRPDSLMGFDDFVELIKGTFYRRNQRDFRFSGEGP